MEKKHLEESVSAVIFSENRQEILLIKRRDVPVWVLPGGGIDLGESPEEAALREVEEETGFSAALHRKVGEYTPLNRLARFTHLYECTITGGKASLSSETQGVAFFSLDKLPPLPPPYPDWIADSLALLPTLLKKPITSVTYTNLCKHALMHPILVGRFLLARLGLPLNDR